MSRERNDSSLERGIALATKLAPFGAVALALGAGVVAGPPLAVLILTGSALIGAIATLWTSVRALVGETPLAPEDAFALGAPSSEEEQKRAVLRAIKDIEFERSVGKISEEDYAALLGRYRAEAKRLLRQIDEAHAPDRARAEALAAKHLANSGDAPTTTKKPAKKKPSAIVQDCPECPVKNDGDAAFCKGCGAKLDAEEVSS